MAVAGTTGPSPALSVFTCVSLTLNGAVTVTAGAAVAVEPVIATLPVVPDSVHSGAPPSAGAAVGQPDTGAAGVVAISVTADDVAVADSVLEPQPDTATAIRAVPMTTAEPTREEVTDETLHGGQLMSGSTGLRSTP